MNFIRLFLFISLSVGGFAFADSESSSDSRPAIIFIPGLYGSALRDVVSKKRIFITPGEAMGGTDTLSLYQKELQTPAGPELEKDGVLEKIVVIPGVYEIDIYGQILDRLRTIPGHQVIPFDYDWRLDIHVAVENLDRLVTQLRARGVKQIDIVGHSGGALIATYFSAYGTQEPESAIVNWAGAAKIHRLVLMGAPFRGSFNIFRDMNRGSTLPMMGHLLPAETISSFPLVYLALPYENGHLLDQDGNSRPFAVGDVNLWKKSQYGLFDRTDLPDDILRNRNQFTQLQIVRGHKYMTLFELPGASAPPKSLKVLNVVGQGTATTDTAYVIAGNHGMQMLFDSDDLSGQNLQVAPLQVDGDGMVSLASSAIPVPLKPCTHTITSTLEHSKLVEDKDVQQRIVDLITGH